MCLKKKLVNYIKAQQKLTKLNAKPSHRQNNHDRIMNKEDFFLKHSKTVFKIKSNHPQNKVNCNCNCMFDTLLDLFIFV